MKTLYESILDADQDEIMDRMEDDMIRRRILEYCTYNSSGLCWLAASMNLKITKIDKDAKGWYVDTMATWDATSVLIMDGQLANSFLDACTAPINKKKGWKDFVVKDENGFTDIHFRWRKHKGSITIKNAVKFSSTLGLPEELDMLQLSDSCQRSNGFTVYNKIGVIILMHTKNINIAGNNYKNVIIYPSWDTWGNVTISKRAELHQPKNHDEYIQLLKKLGY